MSLFEPTKKQLGERAQAHVIAKFLEVGYNVLVPYGDSSRYDLVIEDAEGRFWRVQVKTAWIEGGDQGYIKFATTSLRSRSTNGRVAYSRAGYQGQVDYFAVYSHELRKVYLLPVNEVSQTRMHLRLAPSKNKQERGVHWAADYEI
jgi:PD-(D/E)XK endonuclease